LILAFAAMQISLPILAAQKSETAARTPDKEIHLRWKDYAAGRDPVLEWVENTGKN